MQTKNNEAIERIIRILRIGKNLLRNELILE